jgi:hypothetical protein
MQHLQRRPVRASMTAMDQHAAITARLEIAATRIGDPAAAVYARLFTLHPAMEREFWRDTAGNIRSEMLTRSFEVILDLAGREVGAISFSPPKSTPMPPIASHRRCLRISCRS